MQRMDDSARLLNRLLKHPNRVSMLEAGSNSPLFSSYSRMASTSSLYSSLCLNPRLLCLVYSSSKRDLFPRWLNRLKLLGNVHRVL